MTSLLETARAGFLRLEFSEDSRRRALAGLAAWLERPSLQGDRPQLESLVRRGRFEDLFDAFWQTIPFGTGGRRGPVGIGPNRFNSWTLLTSVQGHAETLREAYVGEEVSVVVAYDVRVFRDLRGVYDPSQPNSLLGMRSADFAREAAETYAANGISVALLDPSAGAYMSTPELSLAIRRNHAHGGLNVSASHNHPDDNGGKFYNRHGGQDVPPHDEILARRVEGIAEVRRLPFAEGVARGLIRFLGPEENHHYLEVNRRLSVAPQARGGRIVFTPLHGTGSCTVGRLLRREGFDVHPVPSQEAFDGGFPGVRFLAPNPEVPSCFEAAERVGDEVGADMLLATDPDADRIGLEIRAPGGGWRFVTGNEILLLVSRFVLDRRRSLGRLPPDGFVLKTLVTSSLVATIARSFGCKVVPDLLVGFKYMADLLATLEEHGAWGPLRARPESFLLGAEESHGLLLTPAVRDKDAAGAALVLAELNATLVAEGRSLHDELLSLYRRFGYVANKLFTTTMAGATGNDRIRAIQASLRAQPPADIGGHRVVEWEDLADERGRLGPLRSGTDAAARNVLVYRLEDDSVLVIRPSGTEPKNKIYVEVRGSTPKGDLPPAELEAEQSRCDRLAEQLGRAFEGLTLARVGLHLTPAACAVSSLLGIEQKLHFGGTFLPELERRARDADPEMERFVADELAAYGRDGRALVAGGVSVFLAQAGLPASADARVRAAFGLSGVAAG